MTDNIVPIRKPVPLPEGLCAEWDVKMRMIPGGWEFDLPPMSMTPNAVEIIVSAFRDAIMKFAK